VIPSFPFIAVTFFPDFLHFNKKTNKQTNKQTKKKTNKNKNKKKSVRKYFAFSALLQPKFTSNVGQAKMYSFSRPILPQGKTSGAKVYFINLTALN